MSNSYRVAAHLFENAETALRGQDRYMQQWALAKYALAVWTDEVLIDAPWEGSEVWTANYTLEWEYFESADAFTEYFKKADEASKLPADRRDALEVFYIGVVLGFRGLYRDPSDDLAKEWGLPEDLETWARETAQGIRLGQEQNGSGVGLGRRVKGAPPLVGRFRFVGVALINLVLASLAIALWLIYSNP
jgi:type VI secretion system protein ImpK